MSEPAKNTFRIAGLVIGVVLAAAVCIAFWLSRPADMDRGAGAVMDPRNVNPAAADHGPTITFVPDGAGRNTATPQTSTASGDNALSGDGTCKGWIYGVALNADNAPISGAAIRLEPHEPLPFGVLLDAPETFGVQSGGDGAFQLGPLRYKGEVQLRVVAEAQGYAPSHSAEVQLDSRITSSAVRLTLASGYALAVEVLENSGSPLAGAQVQIISRTQANQMATSRTQIANSDGMAFFDQVFAPFQQIRASAQGYVAEQRDVRMLNPVSGEQEPQRIQIELEPAVSLSGRVIDYDGRAIPGVQATVQTLGRRAGRLDEASQSMFTGDNGEFLFDALPPDPCIVQLHQEHELPSADLQLSTEIQYPPLDLPAEDVELRLPQNGELSLSLADAQTGLPLAEVEFQLRMSTAEANAQQSAVIDGAARTEGGTLHLRGIPPGAYQLFLDTDGYAAAGPVAVEIAAGQITQQTLALTPGNLATGRLIDTQTNAPVDNAIVVLVRSGEEDSSSASAISDADGRFNVEFYHPDDYSLLASRDGMNFHRQSVALPEQSPTDMGDIRVNPPQIVSGRAVDPNGDPLPDLRVTALSATIPDKPESARIQAHADTDSNGAFRLTLATGDWTAYCMPRQPGRTLPYVFESQRVPVQSSSTPPPIEFRALPEPYLFIRLVLLDGLRLEDGRARITLFGHDPVSGDPWTAKKTLRSPSCVMRLPSLEPLLICGALQISGSTERYQTFQRVEPRPGENPIDLILRDISVRGVAYEQSTGLPLGQAALMFEWQPEELDDEEYPMRLTGRLFQTDTQGMFEARGLAPQIYHVRLRPANAAESIDVGRIDLRNYAGQLIEIRAPFPSAPSEQAQ
ncbi:carboxypeptidase regulatory-like domain-containing protein [Candidatus Sumerlaeota bacterium]|nr:carboxypeptidase regulatory-like domain-containing protein [Candidatus Sumerlaeota bacterium]